jgi:hypothetical protein
LYSLFYAAYLSSVNAICTQSTYYILGGKAIDAIRENGDEDFTCSDINQNQISLTSFYMFRLLCPITNSYTTTTTTTAATPVVTFCCLSVYDAAIGCVVGMEVALVKTRTKSPYSKAFSLFTLSMIFFLFFFLYLFPCSFFWLSFTIIYDQTFIHNDIVTIIAAAVDVVPPPPSHATTTTTTTVAVAVAVADVVSVACIIIRL